MQATVVSKRPPRVLFVALAVILGIVALGAVLSSPLLKGGLAGNPAYQRLLGYAPAVGGTTLAAQGSGDAQVGRVMIDSAGTPAATPAPPAVADQVPSPGAVPTYVTAAPANESEANPNPTGDVGPAMQELNDTQDNLTANPLDSFGLGVLPKNATDLPGAQEIGRFIDPTVRETDCSWTQEVTATDANHDGHPEYVHVKQLGTCTVKDDANVTIGTITVARDVQAWDNDSSGVFNALEARQGLEAAAAPTPDSVYRYHAQALWTLSVQDADEDKVPEYLTVTFAGAQSFDRNGNSNAEFVRSVDASIRVVHNVSGVPNTADILLRVYQTYDLHDDGGKEYQALLLVEAHAVDADHDGINETQSAAITAYESLDANRDGVPELARGVELTANRTGVNADDHAARSEAWIFLYAKADPKSDGVLAIRRALELQALATDANGDGNPELVTLSLKGAVYRDVNLDGRPEVNATLNGTFEAVDADSSGIVERATLHLQADITVTPQDPSLPAAHAYGTLDVLVLNEIQDANPDRVELHYVAAETLDLNRDGVVDETRGMTVDVLLVDANSNGHAEYANVTVHATDVIDTNHDGTPEFAASFDAYAQATDLNDDGHPEYVNVTARGSAVQRAENGTLEMTASMSYDARYVDADSNGVFENVTVTFRAERTTYDANGQVASQEWITLDYSGQDVNQDGTMDNVYLLLEKHAATA